MTAESATPTRLVPWVAEGGVDAELAALLAILVEARVPLVVAGGSAQADRTALRDALSGSLSDGTRVVTLAGPDEDFDWMLEAVELGWRRERGARRRTSAPAGTRTVAADRTALVADLDASPTGTWGERARAAIPAISVGCNLL